MGFLRASKNFSWDLILTLIHLIMLVFKDGEGPARDFYSITPQDDTDLSSIPRAIYVGGAGDLTVTSLDGTTVTFVAVPAGTVLPIMPSRVENTNTTATNLVGLL